MNGGMHRKGITNCEKMSRKHFVKKNGDHFVNECDVFKNDI